MSRLNNLVVYKIYNCIIGYNIYTVFINIFEDNYIFNMLNSMHSATLYKH